jgi:hypothetical protein
MALSATEVLRHIEEQLARTGGVVRRGAVAVTADVDRVGRSRMTLDFSSGHRLDVALIIAVHAGFPQWSRYSFNLLDPDSRCAFRYDNEAHYPTMATFPHHKHVGPDETPEESSQPTLHQIVDETRMAVRGR